VRITCVGWQIILCDSMDMTSDLTSTLEVCAIEIEVNFTLHYIRITK